MTIKEKFLKEFKEYEDIELKEIEGYTKKRNTIYLEIPKNQETITLSRLFNNRKVVSFNYHMYNRAWVKIQKEKMTDEEFKKNRKETAFMFHIC